MSELHQLTAQMRDRVGKGAARATRREERVPGVIYGDKKSPILISLEPKELDREIHKSGFFATLYDIKVGKGTERVIPRDLQLHPVTDRPLHVDFLRVSATSRINVFVPVIFENEAQSPGIKRGGVLNIVRHEIEVLCAPDAMPHEIRIDLTGTQIGDSIHISSVALPANVTTTITERDFTIATIAAPSVQREVAEPAAEPAAATPATAEKKAPEKKPAGDKKG